MSFLAPFFLAGALAVSLPVIFHLIRRTTRERTQFSSLMFLLPSPPRLTRRSRLEHILLLLLRCIVICLLALGFARPFIKKNANADSGPAGARRLVILVDSSASMRRPNLWADAQARADSILAKASPADEVALFTFDRRLNPLVTFEQWSAAPVGDRPALASRKLAEISPGWSGTHLGNALTTAAEALADSAAKPWLGPRQIVLLSDLQEGSRLDQLQGYEWPKGIEVSIEQLKPRFPGNAGLQLLTGAEESDAKSDANVRVRVTNAIESKRDQFKIGWAQVDGRSFLGKPIDIYVPPGQSRTIPVPVPPIGVPADRIILQGDDEDFDNTLFVIPPEQTRFTVLYCGNDSPSNTRESLYFIQRAFQETRHQAVQVLTRSQQESLLASDIDLASLLIVTSSLPEERTHALHEKIAANGKTVLFALPNPESAVTLSFLLNINQLSAEEAHPVNYAMLSEINFRHPLFAPFADPRFSDFTRIHFWKYRRLDASAIPGARVLAKFDNGDPALIEAPVGKGRVLVLTSGWRTEDSQLALSTKFVPLLYSLLEQSGNASITASQYSVGDVVPLPASPGVTVRMPGGSELNLPATETNFSRTTTPGIYTVTSSQSQKRFAVNLDPSESQIAPISADELERLGVPPSRQMSATPFETRHKALLQNAELESRQKLWRSMLIVALAILLLESWLAGRAARLQAPQSPSPPSDKRVRERGPGVTAH
jgi:hypothetical protein